MRQPLIPMSRDKSPRTGFNNSSLEPRRQTMSNQELIAFEDMFNIVFTAANERRLAEDGATAAFNIDTRTPLGDFLKNLSKHPRVRLKGENTELDKLKEQLALCQSDYAMLEWAEREVFGPSIRAAEAARAAASEGKPSPPHLQPPLYPHLLATLMSTARERYDDPHLALALFEHARNLSPLSYIFGCTTPAYNELLETRWDSFRDLRGVHAALEEMRANGVSPDSRTRALVDDVRREVGARTIWLEESETGSGEVWTMLKEIERLVARRALRQGSSDDHRTQQERPQPHDIWKNPELTSDGDAGYRFGEWPEPRRRPSRRASQTL
jgi:Mtf2-like protein